MDSIPEHQRGPATPWMCREMPQRCGVEFAGANLALWGMGAATRNLIHFRVAWIAFEVGGIEGPTVSRDDLEAMDWQLEIAP
jgi:hypothetical protein